jgi:hypothetical protein
MSLTVFDPIRTLNDVRFNAGANMLFLNKLEECYGIAFPEDHLQTLHESNGIEAYGGYIRLFGVETDDSINVIRWNSNEYWKFAWDDRCSKYLCFAETAWGDQHAYHIDELRNLRVLSAVRPPVQPGASVNYAAIPAPSLGV